MGAEKNKQNKVGVHALYEPALNYYIETKQYNWLEPVPRDEIRPGLDYYYINESNFELLNKECLQEVKHFKDTETWAMRKCVKGSSDLW